MGKDSGPDPQRSLFINGLRRSVTADQVTAAFARFGGVAGVNLVTKKATGKVTGYAFVHFASPGSAAQALEYLNETRVQVEGHLLAPISQGRPLVADVVRSQADPNHVPSKLAATRKKRPVNLITENPLPGKSPVLRPQPPARPLTSLIAPPPPIGVNSPPTTAPVTIEKSWADEESLAPLIYQGTPQAEDELAMKAAGTDFSSLINKAFPRQVFPCVGTRHSLTKSGESLEVPFHSLMGIVMCSGQAWLEVVQPPNKQNRSGTVVSHILSAGTLVRVNLSCYPKPSIVLHWYGAPAALVVSSRS